MPGEESAQGTSASRSTPTNYEVPDLGLSTALVGVFVVGLVLLGLSGLLYNIWLSDDGSSAALVKTVAWFRWIGATALSGALVAAGLLGRRASVGVRVALLLVGSYLFINAQTSGSALLSQLFPFF